MDLRLRILALAHLAIGLTGVMSFAAMVAAFIVAGDPEYGDEFAWIGGLLGLATLVYFLPMTLAGYGMMRGRPWARALVWALAPLQALAVPLGTALAGFSLWVLLATRKDTPDGGVARFEAYVRRILPLVACALAALFILGVIVLVGWVVRDVSDPPREPVLTPLPSGVPPQLPEQPELRMPGLPRAPER